jgi:hypothetical protein
MSRDRHSNSYHQDIQSDTGHRNRSEILADTSRPSHHQAESAKPDPNDSPGDTDRQVEIDQTDCNAQSCHSDTRNQTRQNSKSCPVDWLADRGLRTDHPGESKRNPMASEDTRNSHPPYGLGAKHIDRHIDHLPILDRMNTRTPSRSTLDQTDIRGDSHRYRHLPDRPDRHKTRQK